MARWGFHLQIFFLGHRANQHNELYNSPNSAISDRSIYEDAHIFARVLNHLGNMSDRDYEAYKAAYELGIAGLPKPDLLLYLECPVDILVDRIKKRGREMEAGISAEYLATLNVFYKDWISSFDLCPVVTIPSSDLNFVHREDHLDIVVEHVQSRLAGHDNVVFPSCLLYTSPSPRDGLLSRMPSSA